MIALAMAMQHMGAEPIGNAFVVASDGVYLVSLVPVRHLGAALDGSIEITVDRDTGKATAPRAATDSRSPARSPNAPSIPIRAAYEAAIDATQGFEHYDKQAGFSIVLRADHYEITLPPVNIGPASRGVDYAYQIWVDARTSRVEKILVSS
jgi:hypothetical protein